MTNEDRVIAEYAQYIADDIDVTIFLELTNPGMSRDEASALAGPYLRDHGWQGRTYAADFFRYPTMEARLRQANADLVSPE